MKNNNNTKIHFIPETKDICLIDLPNDGEYSLRGVHPCLIFGKAGLNYKIVPISSKKRDVIRLCEYTIPKGTGNLHNDSIMKFDQIRSISCERIERKIGSADSGMLKALSNFLRMEAESIDKIAA
ncbi:MAG: type II toxin-antitoxin system PemK/MazF family toxin [Bacteroidetes bacterium]|nr:type II toxin-antitoxin system PemK/MazF family toxin [Bacteroidota bacterium]